MSTNDYGLNSDALVRDLHRKLGLPDPDDDQDHVPGRSPNLGAWQDNQRMTRRAEAHAAARRVQAVNAHPDTPDTGDGRTAPPPADPINASRHRHDPLKAAIIAAINPDHPKG